MTGNAFISCFFLFLITSLSSIYRHACLFCMKIIATQKKKKSWREKRKIYTGLFGRNLYSEILETFGFKEFVLWIAAISR